MFIVTILSAEKRTELENRINERKDIRKFKKYNFFKIILFKVFIMRDF